MSGLNRTAYCQREGFKLSSFDYQRARIRAAKMAEAMIKADAQPVMVDKKRHLSVAKVTRFIPAIRTDGVAMHTVVISIPELIYVQSPDCWQIDLTLKYITHDSGAVTSLFQLLQTC